jgi:cytidylate kinase
MPVIAMTQEMATLGKDVALGLAEALGLTQVRHEVGDVVAGKMHVKKSLIRRIREGKAGTLEKWSADDKTISIFTAEEVLDLAVKGNALIRGWGATLLLKPVAHIPCIRVCAPMEVRVQRLDTDDEQLARKEIDTDDAARVAKMASTFNVEWGDPVLYDLTINTGRVPIARAVDLVLALVKDPAFAETPQSRQRLLDLALAAKVRAALRANEKTAAVDVAIDVEAGVVTLSGIVATPSELAAAADVAAAAPGVVKVINALNSMSGGVGRRIFPSGLTR